MSSGAAVQIAQYGIENKFVSGEPSTTFFKSVYRRHTNFAIQPMEISFTGSQDLGDIDILDIPRNGDLIKQIYIRVELPDIVLLPGAGTTNAVWSNSITESLVEYAELVIGGQTIQRITGEYGYLQSELRTSESLYPALQEISNRKLPNTNANPKSLLAKNGSFYMPLYFYFHWHPSLAVPLVALNRQDVKVVMKFRSIKQLVQSYNDTGGPNTDIIPFLDIANMEPIVFTPFVEYIFLDQPERNRFMSGQQLDYLIEQTQVYDFANDIDLQSSKTRILPFKHLVKELLIVVQNSTVVAQTSDVGNDWFNYVNPTNSNQIDTIGLWFNDELRLQQVIGKGDYLKYIQPMNHHTRVPMQNIYTYSFAIEPESFEPTGSANFSRMRTVRLKLDIPHTPLGPPDHLPRSVRIYATSLNVLRVCDNLCCLIFK